jgi:hypothetical protein
MLRISILCLLSALLLSCGFSPSGDYTFQLDHAQRKIRIYHKSTPQKLSFEVTVLTNLGDIETTAGFCLAALGKFRAFSTAYDAASGTVRIGPAASWYEIYFQLAVFSMPEIRNDLIRYGLIQTEWRKWIRDSERINDPVSLALRDWKYNLYLEDDMAELFRLSGCEWSDLDRMYPYEVSYLLKQILFISLQEMLSRTARYYNPREFGSIFSQLVTLPEAVAFTGYLTAKYGMDRTMKLARTTFTTNSWKSLTGEFFHDTEGDFTKGLEKIKFTGKFQDAEFRARLDESLKIYNQMTKSTLFRK